MRKRITNLLLAVCFVSALSAIAEARIALLLQQPFGRYGRMNPTGHVAVYLSDICADSPTRLRFCNEGENGVVISRYRQISGYDWLAIPVIPYLYAINSEDRVPMTVDRDFVKAVREEYRRDHLQDIAPYESKQRNDWIELVGAAYERKIYAFEVDTTREQDARVIEKLNGSKNVNEFRGFTNNCADFVKMIFDLYYPGAIRRSLIADAGPTTPKQISKSLVKYAKKHPELNFRVAAIPQVPGLPKSRPVRGVLESLVKSTQYVVPIGIVQPWAVGVLGAGYLVGGRFNPEKLVSTEYRYPGEAVLQARGSDKEKLQSKPPQESSSARRRCSPQSSYRDCESLPSTAQ